MKNRMGFQKSTCFRAAIILLMLVGTYQSGNARGAVTAKTRFAEINNRKIAYRSVGNGAPIILCNRFRGILDSWDPAFIDELAKTHQVVTFDYTGIGLSTGEMGTEILSFARDVKDLAEVLKFKKIVVVGWSFGGLVAQAAAIEYPELVTQPVL